MIIEPGEEIVSNPVVTIDEPEVFAGGNGNARLRALTKPPLGL